MRHTAIAVIVAAALALGSSAAFAQERMTDQQFVSLAAMGGLAEVDLGRLAAERAHRESVQQFARRMVSNHGAMNAELAQLAQELGMGVPTALDDTHQQTKQRLARLTNQAFDRAYMQQMVANHLKDIEHFERQAQTGLDPDLRALAARALPVLRHHLALAQHVNTQVVLGPVERPHPAASPMGSIIGDDPWCSGAYAPTGGTNFGGCLAR